MGKKKCQVCGGPIANGRCKLCGMPYRNDEVLYHLNENRRDHYAHATKTAQQVMRQREIPLGDNKSLEKNAKDPAKMREEIKKQQQKVRQEAVTRMSTTKKQNASTASTYSYNRSKKNTSSSSYTQKKKKKTSYWITIVIFIIILLCSLLPNFMDYVREKAAYSQESIFDSDTLKKLKDYGIHFDL